MLLQLLRSPVQGKVVVVEGSWYQCCWGVFIVGFQTGVWACLCLTLQQRDAFQLCGNVGILRSDDDGVDKRLSSSASKTVSASRDTLFKVKAREITDMRLPSSTTGFPDSSVRLISSLAAASMTFLWL
ncbi:uncharacterized protein LOC144147019 isoform X2 [Haemaphysalis longicornis]